MCFSLDWIMHLAIWIVLAIATYVILIQILLPYLLSKLGGGGEVSQGVRVALAVLKVVVWAIVICVVIYVVFALLSCMWTVLGDYSLFPHR